MKKKLTTKQQRFVDCFDGNATEAARKAGYKGNDNTIASVGDENLRKPAISEAIEKRNKNVKNKVISTREDRQKFWTDQMNDKDNDMKDRLVASKLLGQSDADFTQKIIHDVPKPIKHFITVKFVKVKK